MTYRPITPPPTEYDPKWLYDEFRKVEEGQEVAEELKLKEWRQEPPKPRLGMIVLADGSDWNPGAGQGAYIYYAGAWNKLG